MKRFQAALDRYGSDLDAWPRAEAERGRRMLLVSEEARQALDRLTRIEGLIVATRPLVSDASIRRVVQRAASAVRFHADRPSLVDRFRVLLAAPVLRLAFVMGLTAMGFVLGTVLGAPEIGAAESSVGPVLTASADDGVF
jgi:hypothetical protein